MTWVPEHRALQLQPQEEGKYIYINNQERLSMRFGNLVFAGRRKCVGAAGSEHEAAGIHPRRGDWVKPTSARADPGVKVSQGV